MAANEAAVEMFRIRECHMTITSQPSADGQELTIAISGRFDFNAHQAFRDAYQRQDVSPQRYVVNLQGTTYMDSSALGMLLLLRDHAGGDRDGEDADVVHVASHGSNVADLLTSS